MSVARSECRAIPRCHVGVGLPPRPYRMNGESFGMQFSLRREAHRITQVSDPGHRVEHGGARSILVDLRASRSRTRPRLHRARSGRPRCRLPSSTRTFVKRHSARHRPADAASRRSSASCLTAQPGSGRAIEWQEVVGVYRDILRNTGPGDGRFPGCHRAVRAEFPGRAPRWPFAPSRRGHERG